MNPIKNLNTFFTVGSIAFITYEVMMKTFKWFEKKHKKQKGCFSEVK